MLVMQKKVADRWGTNEAGDGKGIGKGIDVFVKSVQRVWEDSVLRA